MIRSLIYLALLLLFYFPVRLQAQTTADGVEYKPFHIEEVLQLNDTLNAAAVQYGRFKQGIALINNKQEVVFDSAFKQDVIGFGKFGNNDEIIAFYTDDLYDKIQAIYAAVINIKTHTVESDKLIYTLTRKRKHWIDPYLLKDRAGNFKYLLLRTKEKSDDKAAPEVTLLSIPSTSLEPLSHDIQGSAIGSQYVAGGAALNGDWFISSITGTTLVIELYDNTCQLKSKLQTTFDIKDKTEVQVVAAANWNSDATRINLNIRYSNSRRNRAMCAFSFDFASQKAVNGKPVVLNKEYKKQFSEMEQDLKTSTLYNIEALRPLSVFNYNDKIVAVNEIEYEGSSNSSGSSTSNTRYYNEAIIIDIYDTTLNQSRHVVLDKSHIAFDHHYKHPRLFVQGSHLFIIGPEIAGIMTFGEYIYIVDLEKGTKVKKNLHSIVKHGEMMNGNGTMFFKDGFTLVFETIVAFRYTFRAFLYNRTYDSIFGLPDSKK